MKQLQVFVGVVFAWLVIVLCFTLFALRTAQASDQINLGFGPSLDGSTWPHYASIEYEHDWGQFALIANAATFMEDPLIGVYSIIPSAKIVTPGGLFLRCGLGIGWVSHTDDRLSSPAEFNIECAGGLAWGAVELGPRFDHYSNGSPVLGPGPNLGRDAGVLHLGVRL